MMNNSIRSSHATIKVSQQLGMTASMHAAVLIELRYLGLHSTDVSTHIHE